MSNHWYFKLDYNEMESCFEFLLAGTCDRVQKSFRHAIRLDCFSEPEDIVRQLRGLADTIEHRCEVKS